MGFLSLTPSCFQRKYIDLVYKISTKWVNWDPPIEIRVGSYGTIDRETGNLLVEGNIYDPDFQELLDQLNIKIKLAEPQLGAEEDDFVITSSGTKHRDVNLDNELGIPNIASASVKGQWSFECGKREAILIMHRPRLTFLPHNVILEHLYKVDKLIGKWLVTSIHTCPAYTMYFSDNSGDKVSLALVVEAPIAAAAGVTATVNNGFSWLAKAQSGLLRKACDKKGDYLFTPLFALKRPINRFSIKRFFRDGEEVELTGDNLWYDAFPPWDPLDDDGEEDKVDMGIY